VANPSSLPFVVRGRRRIWAALAWLCLPGLVCVVSLTAVGSAPQAPRADFAQIEQQLARAWVEGDRATIDRIIAADWTTTAVTGQFLTRAEVMADMFRDGTKPIAAMTIDDVRVRLLGDVAVVTGRTTARASGVETSIVLRFTDVFALRDGLWQIVASQGTTIAPRSAR
jgi:hypothetical protein